MTDTFTQDDLAKAHKVISALRLCANEYMTTRQNNSPVDGMTVALLQTSAQLPIETLARFYDLLVSYETAAEALTALKTA